MNKKLLVATIVLSALLTMTLLPANAWFHPGALPWDDGLYSEYGPEIENILIIPWGTQALEYEAFKSGQIDLMDWSLQAAQVAELKGLDPDMQTNARVFFTDRGMREFDLNNMRFPCSNKDFRHALAHCFDKDTFVQTTLGGLALKMDSPLAWASGWYNPYCTNLHPFNLQEAADILEAAGFTEKDTDGYVEGPAGQEITVLLYARSDDSDRNEMGTKLATNLDSGLKGTTQGVGVRVNLQSQPKSTCFQEVMVDFDYDIYTGGWGFGRDPTLLYELYRSDEAQAYEYTGNYPGYQNLIFDANGILFLNAPNAAAAKPYIYEMQKQLADDIGIIPVFTYASYGAYKSDWEKIINTEGVGPWGWFTFMNCYKPGTDTLRWGFMNDIESLNPIHSEWTWDWYILDKIYDTLINVDPYDITNDRPWMAKSWEIGNWTYEGETATKFTFKIREDMYWQDVPPLAGRKSPGGTPFLTAGAQNVKVTAEDVKFSIDYTQANDTNWNYDMVEQVVYCDTIDPYTVVVYFDSYMPLWALHKIGGLPIIPKHIWSNIPNEEARAFDPIAMQALAGCGPWEYDYVGSPQHGPYKLKAYHRYFRYHPIDLLGDVDSLERVEQGDTVNINFTLHNEDFQPTKITLLLSGPYGGPEHGPGPVTKVIEQNLPYHSYDFVEYPKFMGTIWHEVWPYFSNLYNLNSWEDDPMHPDNKLSVTDSIDMINMSEPLNPPTYWHVEEVIEERIRPACSMRVVIQINYPNGTWVTWYNESIPDLPACEEINILSKPLPIEDWGLHEIKATIEADPLSGHADQDGYSFNLWSTIKADFNLDFMVDIFDIATVAVAFGSEIGDSNWDPKADASPEYGLIDIFDIALIAINFGWHMGLMP